VIGKRELRRRKRNGAAERRSRRIRRRIKRKKMSRQTGSPWSQRMRRKWFDYF